MATLLEQLQESLSFGPKITFKPDESAPSIYADSAQWSDFRAQQLAEKRLTPQQMEAAVTNYASGTPSNATDAANQATELSVVMSQLMQPDISGAGAGRGFVNPPSVNPEAPTPNTVHGQDLINQAFPEAFRKSPPTGKVNTEGGVDRVNARTEEHGVRAVVGADGKILLTNVNADGSINKGTGSPNSVLGDGRGASSRSTFVAGASAVVPNTPLALNNSLQNLRNTQDYDVARGLMVDIATGITEAKGKLEAEALTFAATKVGLPALEAELQASIQADKNDPLYYPGRGDSPITAEIRGQINTQMNAARVVAQDYLSKNPNMTALIAAENVAKQEFKRVDNLGQRKTAAEIQADARAEERKARKMETLEDVAAGIQPQEMERIALLHPASRNDRTSAAEWYVSKLKSTKGKIEQVLAADNEQLVQFALEDDIYAKQIIAATENATPEEITKRLNKIRDSVNSPGFTERSIQFRAAQLPTGQREQQVKAWRQEAAIGKVDGDKKERAKANLKLALEMERAAQTEAVASDMSKIFPAEGPMGPAVVKAKQITGNASLDSVLNVYLEGASGPERAKKLAEFNAYTKQRVDAVPPSIFGIPDWNVLQQYTVESARNSFVPQVAAGFFRPFGFN